MGRAFFLGYAVAGFGSATAREACVVAGSCSAVKFWKSLLLPGEYEQAEALADNPAPARFCITTYPISKGLSLLVRPE